MNIFRTVAYLLIFVVILIIANVAKAEYIDLKGEEVVAQVPCVMHGKKFLCVVVKKENDTYLVLIDQKGEHSIYKSIKEEAVLIWARDSV